MKQIYICVTPFFPSPGNWRGAYVLDQVKAIQRNSDYEVIVFKPTSLRNKTRCYEVDGIKVHLFPTLNTPSYMFNGLFNGYNGHSFVKAVYSSGIELNRVQYIHTHTGPFAIYGLALRKKAQHIKVFVQHHDLDPYTICNGKLAQWKPNALFRAKNCLRLFNDVDLHICISTPVKDNLLAFPKARKEEIYQRYLDALKPVCTLPSLCHKEVFILYNGVDTNLFRPIQKQKNSNLFKIGCIANYLKLKDHLTLVKAFKILIDKGYSNMRLSLVGSGEIRPTIEKFLKENDLFELVEWPTEVYHDKLPAYYHTLDVFVLPSYFEGFGCVFTEAYACGVPFIGVYNQGASECVSYEEHDKWLVEPRNPQQLADKIERYYMARDEQHLCQPHDINILINNFLQYIERW